MFRENFVNVPFDEGNSELEQCDNEDDIDSERNIFDDIIINDEWFDNPDSTLSLTFVYQAYDTWYIYSCSLCISLLLFCFSS